MRPTIKGNLLATAMLVVGLLIGLFSRNALSQGSFTAPPSSEVGRYQLISCGSAMSPYVYITDTKTGRVWLKGAPSDAAWVEQTSPVFKNK